MAGAVSELLEDSDEIAAFVDPKATPPSPPRDRSLSRPTPMPIAATVEAAIAIEAPAPSLPADPPPAPAYVAPSPVKLDDLDAFRSKPILSELEKRLANVDLTDAKIAKMEPGQILEWVEQKKVRMLPFAMAILNDQLKHGTKREQVDAMHDVLDMNGVRKKESSVGGAATIILNLGAGNGVAQVPWLKGIVDAKAVKKPEGEE